MGNHSFTYQKFIKMQTLLNIFYVITLYTYIFIIIIYSYTIHIELKRKENYGFNNHNVIVQTTRYRDTAFNT